MIGKIGIRMMCQYGNASRYSLINRLLQNVTESIPVLKIGITFLAEQIWIGGSLWHLQSEMEK